MHVTYWAAAQKEDLVLNAVLNWLGAQKKTNLRTLLGEHASNEVGLNGVEESSELHESPEHPLFTLYAKRGECSLCSQRCIKLLL